MLDNFFFWCVALSPVRCPLGFHQTRITEEKTKINSELKRAKKAQDSGFFSECLFHVRPISAVLKYSLPARFFSQNISSSLVSNYDMYPRIWKLLAEPE